jgi:hypothetical protein
LPTGFYAFGPKYPLGTSGPAYYDPSNDDVDPYWTNMRNYSPLPNGSSGVATGGIGTDDPDSLEYGAYDWCSNMAIEDSGLDTFAGLFALDGEWPPEVDFVENGGINTFTLTVHWQNPGCPLYADTDLNVCQVQVLDINNHDGDFSSLEDFNNFAAVWTSTSVEVWVNGHPVAEIEDGAGTNVAPNQNLTTPGVTYCGSANGGDSCIPSQNMDFDYAQEDLGGAATSAQGTALAWESTFTN